MVEVWAVARYDLGVPEDEVGALNMLEFDELLKRKQARDNRERINAGIVAASILNSAPFGDPNRKAATPLDFCPELKAQVKEFDLRELSPEEQKVYLMNMFSTSGPGKAVQH